MIGVMHKRKGRIYVPCGKCASCLKKRRDEWAVRLEQEKKLWKAMYFTTFTYQDAFLTWADSGPTLVKTDLQNFFKRLRKSTNEKIRYFAVGEYGTENKRPHYHAIIFSNMEIMKMHLQSLKAWGMGIVDVQHAEGGATKYVAGYLINHTGKSEFKQPEFMVCSKNLGLNYMKNISWHLEDFKRNYIVGKGGIKSPLPRYYKKKLSDEDRVKLAWHSQNEIKKEEQKLSVSDIETQAKLKNDRVLAYKEMLSKNKKNRNKL